MEVWKDIPGFEGYYQASTLGNIRSVPRVARNNHYVVGKVLKQCYDRDGYPQVALRKDGVSKTRNVHRLVALTFIPNPNNYPEINHKDEVKTNNNVFNLEWCTTHYNVTYGTRVQRMADKRRGVPRPDMQGQRNFFYGKHFMGKDNHASRKTAQYDLEGNLLRVYDSAADAGRDNNISGKAIRAALRRRDKENGSGLSGGFIWAYAD